MTEEIKTIELLKQFNLGLGHEILTVTFSNKYVWFKNEKDVRTIDYNRLLFPAIFQLLGETNNFYPIVLKNVSRVLLKISNIPSHKEIVLLNPGQTKIIKSTYRI